jgi:hypothetical protein
MQRFTQPDLTNVAALATLVRVHHMHITSYSVSVDPKHGAARRSPLSSCTLIGMALA